MDISENSEGLNRTQADPTCPEACTQSGPHYDPNEPDVARVVDAWPDIPDHIRAAVLVLVDTNAKRQLTILGATIMRNWGSNLPSRCAIQAGILLGSYVIQIALVGIAGREHDPSIRTCTNGTALKAACAFCLAGRREKE